MGIKDGNIFEAMRIILPEHRVLMARLDREETRIDRPQLTEDELQEMQYILSEALEEQRMIRATLFHPYGHKIVKGIPQIKNGVLWLRSDQNEHRIPFNQIIKLDFEMRLD